MNKELIQYVRDENGKPFACFVGKDSNHIGWSMCSRKDVFDRKKGRMIAEGRASKGLTHNIIRVHPRIKNEFEKFVDRCKKYYKK